MKEVELSAEQIANLKIITSLANVKRAAACVKAFANIVGKDKTVKTNHVAPFRGKMTKPTYTITVEENDYKMAFQRAYLSGSISTKTFLRKMPGSKYYLPPLKGEYIEDNEYRLVIRSMVTAGLLKLTDEDKAKMNYPFLEYAVAFLIQDNLEWPCKTKQQDLEDWLRLQKEIRLAKLEKKGKPIPKTDIAERVKAAIARKEKGNH